MTTMVLLAPSKSAPVSLDKKFQVGKYSGTYDLPTQMTGIM